MDLAGIFMGLPIAVADFAHKAKDGFVGKLFEFAQEIGEERGPGANNVEQVGGDLARHGEEDVGVLVEFLRKSADGVLTRRRLFRALDLAEVRRLDADAARYLPHGERAVVRGAALPAFAEEFTESGLLHVCSMYYTVSVRNFFS
jgi:hypothetical protein